MIANKFDSKHPYEQFEGTAQWFALNRALNELAENSDLEEKIGCAYIVGFLCKALSANDDSAKAPVMEDMELAHVRSTIAKAQAMMRQADPDGDSMARELIAERRREAARE